MKKFISKIISAVTCTALAFGTSAAVSAETVSVEPDYPIHGNKCGIVYIKPQIDRDVTVKITQYTPDGDYVYYNTVIPAAGEAAGQTDYSFLLEGKSDVLYTISIGVPKYKTSEEPQIYEYEDLKIKDTDDVVDEVLNGYEYIFSVTGGDEFDTPVPLSANGPTKNEENIIYYESTVYFPIADFIPGDVNFDNAVNLYDAIDIAKYMLDESYFTDIQKAAGDYNKSGKTDIYDAIDIATMLLETSKS